VFTEENKEKDKLVETPLASELPGGGFARIFGLDGEEVVDPGARARGGFSGGE